LCWVARAEEKFLCSLLAYVPSLVFRFSRSSTENTRWLAVVSYALTRPSTEIATVEGRVALALEVCFMALGLVSAMLLVVRR